MFDFMTYGRESEHLKIYTDKDKDAIVNAVKKLSGEGKSQREIAKEVGISVGTANKYLRIVK
jgi:transposase